MLNRRGLIGASFALLATPGLTARALRRADGWASLYAAARAEEGVDIYSTLPDAAWPPIRDAFAARAPGIELRPVRIATIAGLFDRYRQELAAGQPTADLLLASDVDQWAMLAGSGALRALAPPRAPAGRVFTFARELQAFYYNLGAMPAGDRPDTLSALAELAAAQPDRFKGRILAYDPFRSDFACSVFWALMKRQGEAFWHALDRIGPFAQLDLSAPKMLARTAAGEAMVALYIPQVFANDAATSAGLAGILPRDGVPVYPRDMGVPVIARHPKAAALLVDFLLSHAGQEVAGGGSGPRRDERAIDVAIVHDPAFAANRGAFLARLHASFGR